MKERQVMARNSNIPFDTETLLAGIRRWVEIESPTTDAAAVNRCADAVAGAFEYARERPPVAPARSK